MQSEKRTVKGAACELSPSSKHQGSLGPVHQCLPREDQKGARAQSSLRELRPLRSPAAGVGWGCGGPAGVLLGPRARGAYLSWSLLRGLGSAPGRRLELRSGQGWGEAGGSSAGARSPPYTPPARAPGCGGGAPRGGSAGSQPRGPGPPILLPPPPARALPAGGRLGLRPPRAPRSPPPASPSLAGALPPSPSRPGPRPRSTSSGGSKLPRPGLFVPPRVPNAGPASSPASPEAVEPRGARGGPLPSPGSRRPPWGPPRGWEQVSALDGLLTRLRGRRTGATQGPRLPAPGCRGLSPPQP